MSQHGRSFCDEKPATINLFSPKTISENDPVASVDCKQAKVPAQKIPQARPRLIVDPLDCLPQFRPRADDSKRGEKVETE